MVSLQDIHIRDPFILPDPQGRLYYLYSAAHADGRPVGFNVRTSPELLDWSDPQPVFRAPDGFWADRDFWAPEVHAYGGAYYLLASFKAQDTCRGTQVLRADAPTGPFMPISDGPVTPRDWECLDGTLLVDADGMPWMVFCHEWLQVQDGTICAIPLTADLVKAAGQAVTLFSASQAPWVTRGPRPGWWVTDGPSMHRTPGGSLLMIWSSFTETGYSVGIAHSASGTILGPWQHESKPLFDQDGGHGSLFRTFKGNLLLSLHQSNSGGVERGKLIALAEANDTLRLA